MLFSALWPDFDRPGAITFWFAPSKLSLHTALRDFAKLTAADWAEFRAQADADKEHVYFGLGLRQDGLTQREQGGKKHVTAIPAIALDIDFAHPSAHKAKNLPPDLESVIALIQEHAPGVGAIVSTGHGVHLYWFFDKPLELVTPLDRRNANEAYEKFQQPIIAAFKARGWHLDLTATINRVWRVPGFANPKSGAEVTLLECDPTIRHRPEDLGFKRSSAAAAQTAPGPTGITGLASSAVPTPPTSLPSVDIKALTIALMAIGPSNRFYQNIRFMLAGQSFADPGERDTVMQGVCSTIAWLPEGRDCDPDSLAEIMRPSFTIWAADPGAKTVDEELTKASEKIERSQEDYREQQEKKRPALEALARSLGLAEPDKVKPEIIEQHAIIQKRSTFYVFDFARGSYSHPLAQNELMTFIRDAWKKGPIGTHWVDDKGKKKRRSQEDILDRNSKIAERVAGDLTIEESWFDADKCVFFEAMARRRVTEARYDPQIDTWLQLLSGPYYDKLLDWLAGVPQLQHQLCSLYLSGKSGAGKGLLAGGISRIWTEGGSTPFENVLGDFNNDLTECPLIFADEGMPQHKGNVSIKFRSLIGSSTFSMNEKYVVSRKVSGSVRLLIAANNENAISFANEYLGIDDLAAISARILHVPARQEAADWLDANNVDGALTESWVAGDRVAKHVLHLAQTRMIKRGKRFLVEGVETSMHRNLLVESGDLDSLIYEWLVRYASNPAAILPRTRTKGSLKVFIGDGAILINTQCMIDYWDAYMAKEEKPSVRRAGAVLIKLATSSDVRLASTGRVRYHRISGQLILDWCKRNQVGDEEAIENNLAAASADEESDDSDDE